MCDWFNLVFGFDDPFNKGELNDGPEEARKLVADLLATMESPRVEDAKATDDILLEVFRSIWLRFPRTSSRETQRRFRSSMTDYRNGVIRQTGAGVDPDTYDLNGFLARKCQTGATRIMFAIVEYCCHLDISDEVIACESIQAIC